MMLFLAVIVPLNEEELIIERLYRAVTNINKIKEKEIITTARPIGNNKNIPSGSNSFSLILFCNRERNRWSIFMFSC